MLFNSLEFAAFLPAAFLIHRFACGKSARAEKKTIAGRWRSRENNPTMRKTFLLFALLFSVLAMSGCNPVSYFMLYQYSSSEKPDTVADQRMSELEREREKRMMENSTYRDAEVDAYRRSRGISGSPETVDTRPVSTEELRRRMEKQAEERRSRSY